MGARDPVATFQQSVSSILNLNIKIGGEGEEASVSRDTYFKVDVSMSINLPSPKFMFQEDFKEGTGLMELWSSDHHRVFCCDLLSEEVP